MYKVTHLYAVNPKLNDVNFGLANTMHFYRRKVEIILLQFQMLNRIEWFHDRNSV